MEKFVIDQIKYGLKYLPKCLAASYFKPLSSAETEAFRKKAGGFICGVCHPNENYAQLERGNIEWIRIDIPFPYDENGAVRKSYEDFKDRCKGYKDRGFKVMAVTPYPRDYIDAGIDPRENEQGVRDTAVFLIRDLRPFIDAVQITNEMGMPHFTLPLTQEEAARFIGINAEAMYDVKQDILVGYNSAGPQVDLHLMMKPYHKFCDYVGIDIYVGCFANVGGLLYFFDALVRYLWNLTGKPVVIQEFGYISGGAPKTEEEKRAILREYGVESIEEAYEKIELFVENLNERMKEHIRYVSPDVSHQGDFIFKSDYVNHLFKELPKTTLIPGYPHTPEGQAKFFRDVIPRMYNLPFVGGTIVYCYADSEKCYMCDQPDCPTETRWGLVDVDGNEKPSYYAVRKAFGRIRGKCPY
ncbi:MAG: hypothetical protein IKW76_07555 [Clostridia bacterium]|nr:hypothetical protein [Clostridia bacterium]